MTYDKNKILLLKWLLHAVTTLPPPGAWEYDEKAVDLIDTTAHHLNIDLPWSYDGEAEIKQRIRELEGL